MPARDPGAVPIAEAGADPRRGARRPSRIHRVPVRLRGGPLRTRRSSGADLPGARAVRRACRLDPARDLARHPRTRAYRWPHDRNGLGDRRRAVLRARERPRAPDRSGRVLAVRRLLDERRHLSPRGRGGEGVIPPRTPEVVELAANQTGLLAERHRRDLSPALPLEVELDAVKRNVVEEALRRYDWNISAVARETGLGRAHIRALMRARRHR
jgi:hypothetical protein